MGKGMEFHCMKMENVCVEVSESDVDGMSAAPAVEMK